MQANDSASETPIGKHVECHFQSPPCSSFIPKEKLSCLPTINIHNPVRNWKTYNPSTIQNVWPCRAFFNLLLFHCSGQLLHVMSCQRLYPLLECHFSCICNLFRHLFMFVLWGQLNKQFKSRLTRGCFYRWRSATSINQKWTFSLFSVTSVLILMLIFSRGG